MSYYPIFVELQGLRALVVGGGRVARRKIDTLLDHGAAVRVVARELVPPLPRYLEEGRIEYLGDGFSESSLEGAFIVVAATDDEGLNRRVSEAARKRGLLVNAVDQPADCNFIVPSILQRGDLKIAVSTSGKSPALAKRIREELERSFGPEYGSLLNIMGELRRSVLARGLSGDENRRIFQEVAGSGVLDALEEGDWARASAIVNRAAGTSFSQEEIAEMASGVTGTEKENERVI